MFLVMLAAACAVQATQADDVSCKWLLTGMAAALVMTNSFWGLWVKAILKEKDNVVNERISDLRQAAMKIKTD